MSDKPTFQRCNHIKANGFICRANALKGESFCYFHYRARLVRRSQTASPQQFAALLPVLDTSENIQAALDQIVHAVASGQLEPRRASVMLRALQLASVNLQNTEPFRLFSRSAVSEVHPRISSGAATCDEAASSDHQPSATPDPNAIDSEDTLVSYTTESAIHFNSSN